MKIKISRVQKQLPIKDPIQREEKEETLRERIERIANERGDFVTDVDGYVYYWPTDLSVGSLSERALRVLADILKERNAEWDAEVQKYFNEEDSSEEKA